MEASHIICCINKLRVAYILGLAAFKRLPCLRFLPVRVNFAGVLSTDDFEVSSVFRLVRPSGSNNCQNRVVKDQIATGTLLES
jgi:hypothetical protein